LAQASAPESGWKVPERQSSQAAAPTPAPLPAVDPAQLEYRPLRGDQWRGAWTEVLVTGGEGGGGASGAATPAHARDGSIGGSVVGGGGGGGGHGPSLSYLSGQEAARRAGGGSIAGGSAARGSVRSASRAAHAARIVSARTAGAASASVRSHAAGSVAASYPEVFESLPMMDAATAETIARGNSFATSRRMGYADPRPDIRPPPLMRFNPEEQGALALHFNAVGGPQKKADAAWASKLRGHLYAASADPKAARTGGEMKARWAGGGLAPSETMPSYAYRHAAATSQVDGAGTVYHRLTDARGYTGTHRHRFDGDGRGLGLAGRENSVDAAYLMSRAPTDARFGAPVMLDDRDVGPQQPGMGRM
jgi:hypothetical protein